MKLWDDLRPAEKVKRWEGVLRVLRGLTPHERKKHFDMRDWLAQTECGTVGCAAGHCAVDPYFRRQGFAATKIMCGCEECAKVGGYYYEMPDVDNFFGWKGTSNVFYKHKATYADTVRNVKRYISDLRKEKPKKKSA